MAEFRIAIFTGNYNHIQDGVSLTLNRLVRFLIEHNIEVLVFGPTIQNPPVRHAGEFIPVPSVSIPGRREYRLSLRLPRNVRRRLDSFSPDLIHIATPDFLGYKAMRYGLTRKIPLVSSYHTHFASYLKYYRASVLEPLLWKYLLWFYRHFRHIYVPAESLRAELIEHGMNHQNLKIWSRGVDTVLFSPEKRSMQWRKDNGFSEEDFIVVFVSRLVWEKDLHAVAETFKKISAKQNVRTLIVGDGPAKKDLEKMLPQSHFTGYLSGDELSRAYAGSDVFFFPSDTESFGNVTLEAMSCGLPVVVAEAGGSISLVENEKNGYIGPPHNSDDFANYIELLQMNKPLRLKMGEASRRKALKFDWTICMQGLLDNYYAVLNQNTGLK